MSRMSATNRAYTPKTYTIHGTSGSGKAKTTRIARAKDSFAMQEKLAEQEKNSGKPTKEPAVFQIGVSIALQIVALFIMTFLWLWPLRSGGSKGSPPGSSSGGGKFTAKSKGNSTKAKSTSSKMVASASRISSTARNLIFSGAAYLKQVHVQASIQKFRVQSMGTQAVALRRLSDGKFFALPKVKLPAHAKLRSIVAINTAALRPAPVGIRAPIRVTP